MIAQKLMQMLLRFIVIFIGIVNLGYADIVVLDNFETYEVDAVMDNNVGGWNIVDNLNSNLNSPIVKDGNSYTEINGSSG